MKKGKIHWMTRVLTGKLTYSACGQRNPIHASMFKGSVTCEKCRAIIKRRRKRR